jgi:hypothetical protein
VWHGELANVYDAATAAYALPLSFILMAPVAALVDLYPLVEGIVPLARPNAWLVVGPYSLLFGVSFVDAVRRLAWDLGQRRHLWGSTALRRGTCSGAVFRMRSFRGRNRADLRDPLCALPNRSRSCAGCPVAVTRRFIQAVGAVPDSICLSDRSPRSRAQVPGCVMGASGSADGLPALGRRQECIRCTVLTGEPWAQRSRSHLSM